MSANKIGLIIRREYFTRVRKKSFIIMSLLGPLIMAGVLTFAMWTSIEESDDQKILVIDDNYPFFEKLDGSDKLSYSIMDISLPKGEALLEVSDYTALLYLPENILQSKSGQLIFKKQPSIKVQRQIEETVQQYLEISKLKEFDITEGDYNRLKAPFNLLTFQFKGAGAEAEETNMLPAIVGLVFGILIYFFIFMYSVQVMRGVIEEKTNRIIEVMISSVKPFQLMMGKIIGVGAVGLTQFALWILLTLVLALGGQFLVLGDKYDAAQVKTPMTDMVQQQVDQEQSLNLTRLSQKDNLFNKIRRISI